MVTVWVTCAIPTRTTTACPTSWTCPLHPDPEQGDMDGDGSVTPATMTSTETRTQ